MKKRMLASMACIFLSIILMCLPYGVAMPFAPSPGETVVSYFSYFSNIPMGYGNWCPMLAAVLSIALLVVLAASFRYPLFLVRRICAGLLPTLALLSWLIFAAYTPLSLIIFLLHLTACVLQFWQTEKL